MAKLPGIKYNTAVPSLGREDPMGPIRVAQAQANAANRIGQAVGQVGDAYKAIKQEEGRNALVDAASAWRLGEAKIRTNPNIDERNEQAASLRRDIEEEYTGGLHSVSAKEFKRKWDAWSQEKLDGVITDGIEEQYVTQRETTQTNALSMAREGDLSEATAYLSESSVLTATEKAEITKSAKLEFALGDLERTTNSEDPDAIAGLLEEIKDPDYTGPLEDSNREAAINQLESAFATATLAREQLVAHDRERLASDLELGIKNGTLGPVDVNAAFEEKDENGDHIITGPKRTQLLALYDSLQEQLQGEYQKLMAVDQYMATGQAMDRENKDHVDAVDFAYDNYVRMNGDNPQMVAEYGVNLAEVTNILPESLEADLRRLAFGGSPKAVESMANIYVALEERAPQTVDGIGIKEKAIYKSTLAFFRGGTDLERAVEMAKLNAHKNPEEKAMLNTRYAIEVNPNTVDGMSQFQSWLESDDQFDLRIWGEAPKATNANYTAYQSLEKAYWAYTDGDINLTRQMARDDYKRLFSVSEIGGMRRIMPYAPEREYGLAPGDKSMDDQLWAYYRAEGIDGLSPELHSDAVTARDPLGRRTYGVYVRNEYGGLDYHGRWKMDMSKAAELQDKEAQAQQDLERKIDEKVGNKPPYMGMRR